ncbi:MAG: D-tyrosyl-tRNA(Tyr) deacylase [Clostridia bacterium]|nr:D-tyrosyl-tRNA(Tyr) deacylase [Clostridia bacterium]
MIAVLQRISEGSVVIDGECVAKCTGAGILVLLGVAEGDGEEDAILLADKISKTRIFSDENGKMNLSVIDIGGGIIVVPNFTLLASYRKGNRPDYMHSARPEIAKKLFEFFAKRIGTQVENTTCGVFGADMKVSIVNDGPVTLVFDSNVLKQPRN